MSRQIFDGLKIADFSWYAVGPWAVKFFADYGATVVRIESSLRIDGHRSTPPFQDGKPGINRSAAWNLGNNNKYGVTLNMRHPRGLEIAKKFIAWADIMVENFTPGTMKKLGLDYQAARSINPGIIYLSSCNKGQSGPHHMAPGFGSHLSSASGFVNLTGWPDREPVVIFGPYTDFVSCRYIVVALAAALEYRSRTGKGQYIDLAQYEASLHFLGPLFLDYQANNSLMARQGNRSSCACPHGVFPARGIERWIAIAVFSDREWDKLCQAMGRPAWSRKKAFQTFLGRKAREDELEKLIAEWTKNYEAHELMSTLQKAGVRAGVVQDARDIYQDEQIRCRGQLVELEHREIGKHLYPGTAFKLSKTPFYMHMAAPCLGQHNEFVYTKLLGLSDEEFVGLQSCGALD